MKLTVHQLRQLIREQLILELDIQPGATLYHRSRNPNLKAGEVLGGEDAPDAKGPHRNKRVEKVLEEIRKRDFPNAPSRLTGAFATLQPATRFASYGHLYTVEAVGKTLVANSGLIDRMWDEGGRAESDAMSDYNYKPNEQQQKWVDQAIRRAISWEATAYWEGARVDKANIRDIEVVAEGLKVTSRVDEEHRLSSKMIFKAPAQLTGGADWDSADRIRRIEDDLKSAGCTVGYVKGSYRETVKVTIPQGTVIQICRISFLGGTVGVNYGHRDPEDYNPKHDAPLKNLDVIPMGMSRFPKGCESLAAAQSNEEPLSPVVLDKESIRAVVAAHKKGTLDIISRE
jgi:hypothetical protein